MKHGGLQREREFPQGGGPWVSVLIPTRGRPDKLRRAIESLHSNAKHPEKVEYLFRLDEDDDATRQLLADCSLPGKVVVGPRGRGYLDLHEYTIEMAKVSGGDWLMIFNDDAVMLTEGWDAAFCGRVMMMVDGEQCWAGCPDGIFLLMPTVASRPQSPEFFAVHRRAFEVLGHLGQNTGIDNWIDFLFKTIGRWARGPIMLHHENEDDLTFREGRKLITDADAEELTSSPRVLCRRMVDVVKLLDYIEAFEHGECDG